MVNQVKNNVANRAAAATVSSAPILGQGQPSESREIITTVNGEPKVTGYKPVGESKAAAGDTTGKVPGGAAPAKTTPVTAANVQSKTLSSKDLRVRIKVPTEYQKVFPTFKSDFHGGIIFPYTPQISVEHRAEYTPQTPLHSNYALNFYKNSMVSDISIQGIFTVQNDIDAAHLLGTIHLLRALTKGRFGGTDPFKGSPPPICRLYAYGAYMLDKVPVVISSFKQDFPSDVDYYHFTEPSDLKFFGEAFVPTRCTISIVCKPMFSRNEMLSSATVPQWLAAGNSSRTKGIL